MRNNWRVICLRKRAISYTSLIFSEKLFEIGGKLEPISINIAIDKLSSIGKCPVLEAI